MVCRPYKSDRDPVCAPAGDDEIKLVVEPSPQGQLYDWPCAYVCYIANVAATRSDGDVVSGVLGCQKGQGPCVLRLSLKYVPFDKEIGGGAID